MTDIYISPLVESWKIANLTDVNFGLVDVPGLSPQTSLLKMVGGEPQWIEALDYTTSDILSASDNFRNALIHNPPLVGTEGYKHTHEGLYDIIAAGGTLPNATNWHFHNGLDILTAGVSSDADALHTHDSFSTIAEVDALISTSIDSIDLDVYVRIDGGINQLSDITSTGETIEAAVIQAHAQDHTLLDHTDAEDPFTIANFKKLLDGSNADYYHTHSNIDGAFPKLKYIVGYTIVDDPANLTSASGTQWGINKVIIKAMKVQTNSIDWDLILWTNDSASNNGIYDNGYINLASSDSGDQVLLLDLPYIDYDSSSSVHLQFLDNSGNDSAIVDIYGIEAIT